MEAPFIVIEGRLRAAGNPDDRSGMVRLAKALALSGDSQTIAMSQYCAQFNQETNQEINMKHLSLIALACALAGPAAHAADIFNNFGPGNSFTDGGLVLQGPAVGTIGKIDQADAFTTDGNGHILDTVSLGVYADTGPTIISKDGLTIQIAADAAGLPGSVLASADINNIPAIGKQIVTATFGSLDLAPNTTYWVIANSQGGYSGSWDTNNIGDLGPTAGRANNGAWNLDGTQTTRFVMELTGTTLPVPEPQAGALMLIGTMLTLSALRPKD